jgi:hypothetical protein
MLVAFSLCWLGIGLWVLADPGRMQRALALAPSSLRSAAARLAGTGALALAAWSLAFPVSLVVVVLLILFMTTLTMAVLLFPLRPRIYALTLPLAALVAAVARVFR